MHCRTILRNMTLEGQIRDKKLQYNINRDAAKISSLLSGNTKKYE